MTPKSQLSLAAFGLVLVIVLIQVYLFETVLSSVLDGHRNLLTGANIERTFNSGQSVQDVSLDFANLSYLYNDGEMYHFMDNTTFEQPAIQKEYLGEGVKYLTEGMEVKITFYKGKPITTMSYDWFAGRPGAKRDGTRFTLQEIFLSQLTNFLYDDGRGDKNGEPSWWGRWRRLTGPILPADRSLTRIAGLSAARRVSSGVEHQSCKLGCESSNLSRGSVSVALRRVPA